MPFGNSLEGPWETESLSAHAEPALSPAEGEALLWRAVSKHERSLRPPFETVLRDGPPQDERKGLSIFRKALGLRGQIVPFCITFRMGEVR
jgi:hypothetical protein